MPLELILPRGHVKRADRRGSDDTRGISEQASLRSHIQRPAVSSFGDRGEEKKKKQRMCVVTLKSKG